MNAPLYLWPAETLAHAESMRVVRNACREFMTRNTHEITVEDQREWFTSLDRDTQPFIGVVSMGHAGAETIAYGLLRLVENKWWLSGGLLPTWRGQGYGRQLFAELTRRVHARRRTAWLEVRKSNGTAERLYRSLGFIVIEDLGEILVMKQDPR